jgi:hypothetical protein
LIQWRDFQCILQHKRRSESPSARKPAYEIETHSVCTAVIFTMSNSVKLSFWNLDTKVSHIEK